MSIHKLRFHWSSRLPNQAFGNSPRRRFHGSSSATLSAAPSSRSPLRKSPKRPLTLSPTVSPSSSVSVRPSRSARPTRPTLLSRLSSSLWSRATPTGARLSLPTSLSGLSVRLTSFGIFWLPEVSSYDAARAHIHGMQALARLLLPSRPRRLTLPSALISPRAPASKSLTPPASSTVAPSPLRTLRKSVSCLSRRPAALKAQCAIFLAAGKDIDGFLVGEYPFHALLTNPRLMSDDFLLFKRWCFPQARVVRRLLLVCSGPIAHQC